MSDAEHTALDDEPVIGGGKPILVTLERAGKRVLWCACGRSKRQPFCDGSHKGTSFLPLVYTARRDGEEVLLCACKRTGNAPFCDGSHNSLTETYAEADEEEISASASIALSPRSAGDFGRADLDGGCYVLTPEAGAAREDGGWRMARLIGPADGARRLSQIALQTQIAAPSPLSFGDSEVVVFVTEGRGEAIISGRRFAAAPETAFTVRPGEAFTLESAAGEPLTAVAAVCPLTDDPQTLAAMPDNFDGAYPDRAARVEPGARQTMGDRFYQVLADPATGAGEVTQFIGEIPQSRAAAHRHLYEEAILILSGEGYMWTEDARAAVKPGDIIFLPAKQLHSLECTNAEGMRIAGAFYPSGSPAVNY